MFMWLRTRFPQGWPGHVDRDTYLEVQERIARYKRQRLRRAAPTGRVRMAVADTGEDEETYEEYDPRTYPGYDPGYDPDDKNTWPDKELISWIVEHTSWGGEFDEEGDAKTIKKIWKDDQINGQTWRITTKRFRPKTSDPRQRINKLVVVADGLTSFPNRETVEILTQEWGGGSYVVTASKGTKVSHSYTLLGEPLDPEEGTGGYIPAEERRDNGGSGDGDDPLDEMALSLISADPELQRQFALAKFSKKHGVRLQTGPKGPQSLEDLPPDMQDYLDNHPEEKERWIQKALGIRPAKSGNDMESVLVEVARERLMEFVRGGGDTSSSGWSSVFREFVSGASIDKILAEVGKLQQNQIEINKTRSGVQVHPQQPQRAPRFAAPPPTRAVPPPPARPAQPTQPAQPAQAPPRQQAQPSEAPPEVRSEGQAALGTPNILEDEETADDSDENSTPVAEAPQPVEEPSEVMIDERIKGPDYRELFPSLLQYEGASDGYWDSDPIEDPAEAAAALKGYLPDGIADEKVWMLQVDWAGIREQMVDTPGLIRWLVTEKVDPVHTSLFDLLAGEHPVTVLTFLKAAIDNPMLSVVNQDAAVVAQAFLKEQVQFAGLMATAHETWIKLDAAAREVQESAVPPSEDDNGEAATQQSE